MEQIDRILALWLDKPWVSLGILAFAALASLAVGLLLRRQQRRYAASAKRMEHTRGLVRAVELLQWSNDTGGRRSALRLEVDFKLGDAAFCCRRFELFHGDPPPAQMQEAATLRAGEGVRVHYDRLKPEVCALTIGPHPNQFSSTVAFMLAAGFAGLGIYMAARLPA